MLLLGSVSTRVSTTALRVVVAEILVGISHRTVRGVKLLLSLHCTSNCNTVNSCGVREGLSMVIVGVRCRGGMRSTVKVVMVIMTSVGIPMGKAHSRRMGKLIF